MPQPIQLRHTTSPTNTPSSADGTTAHLLPGEPAVAIAPANVTKMWVGETGGNRLLLSTVDTDAPLLTAPYAKLNGATFSGAVVWATVPTLGGHLTNKDYVDQAVASSQLYMGTYNAATNVPDLSLTANHPTVNGAYFVVSHAGTIPVTVPGIATPTPVNPGDHLVWNGTLSEFSIIPAGGMTQQDGDARYLQLVAGGTVSGVVILSAAINAGSNANQAVTKSYVDGLVTGVLTAVEVDGTTIGGDGTSGDELHVVAISGGTF